MSDEDNTPPEEPRTIFSPATAFSAAPADAPPPEASVPPPPPAAPIAQPTGEPRRIQIGDVLNHIFEVKRFIARGGMGEVFEGINVNSEERVAIKVILPHLAADPAVQAMFRKEARTLTRLSHAALVQYRVLAQEPALGVFYIVTEFIDGRNLSTLLKEIHAGAPELTMLARRLAEGLAAAHALGAIHRDISPDNVILPDGRLDRAKVIDFGIAKDLDASTGTIVGDGFAGKLGYVAPEQLGDFNREVGPWTDVYSLGLTLLAVASGRDVDMGATLVDAVDKRRAGPDLAPIPAELRPVFQKMLMPNPVDRARSMEEVLHLLSGSRLPAGDEPRQREAGGSSVAAAAVAKPAAAKRAWAGMDKDARRLALITGSAGLALLVLGGGYWMLGRHAQVPQTAAGTPVANNDPAAIAREVLAAGLDSVPCAWLDLANVENKGNGVAIAVRGVAGKPAEVQGTIGRLLAAKGLQASSLDQDEVSPIDANECGPLEAFRKVRSRGTERLSMPQHSFQMATLGPEAGTDAGKLGGRAIINIDLNGLADEATLVGLEPSGAMTQLTTTKRELTDPPEIQKPLPGIYRVTINTTHAGWSGILMLTGKPPFEPALLSGPAGSHGSDWPERFLALARARGWKSEMVWYRTTQ